MKRCRKLGSALSTHRRAFKIAATQLTSYVSVALVAAKMSVSVSASFDFFEEDHEFDSEVSDDEDDAELLEQFGETEESRVQDNATLEREYWDEAFAEI